MPVYTSYYACKNKPPKTEKIAASLIAPRWFEKDGYAKELAPSKELLFDYKNGKVDKKEYRRIYLEQLSKLDAKKVYDDYNGKILYCYEKATDFCHRHLVREWLKDNGYMAVELPTKIMKIGVIGSRCIDDYDIVKTKLDNLRQMNDFVLITGGETGVDRLAERYASENDVKKVVFKADKKKDGKNAHRERNLKVVNACDILIAFWDGSSKGTKSVIELAKNAKKEVIIVHVKDNNV